VSAPSEKWFEFQAVEVRLLDPSMLYEDLEGPSILPARSWMAAPNSGLRIERPIMPSTPTMRKLI
jgi:hypothetical protein